MKNRLFLVVIARRGMTWQSHLFSLIIIGHSRTIQSGIHAFSISCGPLTEPFRGGEYDFAVRCCSYEIERREFQERTHPGLWPPLSRGDFKKFPFLEGCRVFCRGAW